MKTTRLPAILAWAFLVVALAVFAVSWMRHGLVYQLLSSDAGTAERKVEQLKEFFRRMGVFAPAVYLLFVTVEVVVAPVPGLMLYAPGGVVFGAVPGGTLALFGNVLGAGISCAITRSLTSSRLLQFLETERLESTRRTIEAHGMWIVFLLRVNPLTSSDIVSYAAGFTRIPIWKVMMATALGMAPLCYAQAWFAESLINSFPDLLYPLVAACLVYAVVVVLVMRRVLSGAVQEEAS